MSGKVTQVPAQKQAIESVKKVLGKSQELLKETADTIQEGDPSPEREAVSQAMDGTSQAVSFLIGAGTQSIKESHNKEMGGNASRRGPKALRRPEDPHEIKITQSEAAPQEAIRPRQADTKIRVHSDVAVQKPQRAVYATPPAALLHDTPVMDIQAIPDAPAVVPEEELRAVICNIPTENISCLKKPPFSSQDSLATQGKMPETRIEPSERLIEQDIGNQAQTQYIQPRNSPAGVYQSAGYEKEKRQGPGQVDVKSWEYDSNSLRVSGTEPLRTSEPEIALSKASSQGTISIAAEEGEQTVKVLSQETGQAASQAAGQAGASAAAGAASGGATVAIQAGVKITEKVKETLQAAAQTIKENSKPIGAFTALFFIPVFFALVIAATVSTAPRATNRNLSQGVLDLMPDIVSACEKYGIPEYAPLAAAVMMQESGGNVDLVNGDVMMCAEAMGYPVFTPVPVKESIDYGVKLISQLLQSANVQGPDDVASIKLALQAYNFGPGYISWVQQHYNGRYSKENAVEFSIMMANQQGWSSYGDTEYPDHVLRYYQIDTFGSLFGDSSIEDGFFAYPCSGHGWNTYPGHEGIDISWGGCYGEPVYAVANGIVTYTHSGWTSSEGMSGIRSYGNTIWLSHSNGWQSRYGHLSAVVVQSGENVTQGQLLGYIGSTGNSSGPHLHLALYDPTGNPFNGSKNWAEVAWAQHKE